MDPVVHFEMPYRDRERMARFYQSAFGWKTQMFGPEMGNYVLATTAEQDAKREGSVRGAINGGFFAYRREDARPASLGRHRRGRHPRLDEEGQAGRRRGAGRADGDPRCRPVRRLLRHRAQPRQHAAGAARREPVEAGTAVAAPDAVLDQVFWALSDATRRSVVDRLTQGPASVSDLAQPHAMSLPGFMKHLRVLEEAGAGGARQARKGGRCGC